MSFYLSGIRATRQIGFELIERILINRPVCERQVSARVELYARVLCLPVVLLLPLRRH
jgi:hypothetical protein